MGTPELIVRVGDALLVVELDGAQGSRVAISVVIVERDDFVIIHVLHSFSLF